ncbi:MAG: flagellar M-ring protein FliF [Proteobacteria bacterium]|nr:flagellar M-ring protein FliF [Pseudomonadota bacterium]
MASTFGQMFNNFKEIPLSRKIATFAIVFLVVAGVGSIVLWANKAEYKVVFTNLETEDSAEIVGKLKELKIPYTFERNESVILVPANRIHEARLGLASSGLPKGGVGFEIFDKTDFGTTEFVQKLNFQRALQGELARTIKEMDEVRDARVIIVLPKDSVFVENVKPPSASVFLKLRSKMAPGKVEAIVHLVASSVEDLTPELVTVVDSDGKVLSRGTGVDESNTPLNKQLEYKLAYEKTMAGRVQTMLEEIVGPGKAIVRVTADMDFKQVDMNEEIYDPDAQVVRSRQNITDQSDKKDGDAGMISSVNPIGNTGNTPQGRSELNQHNDETVNYEISKTVRVTQNPVGALMKLSVAAVLDGNYKWEKNDKGAGERVYVPRTPEELTRFETIVKQAMGYSADREDQVSVESIPFSSGEIWDKGEEQAGLSFKWSEIKSEYGRPVLNIMMILLLFIFVVRPLLKTFKQVTEGGDDMLLEDKQSDRLIFDDQGRAVLPKPRATTIQERAMLLAREDINRSANIIKGWLSEGED